MDAALLCVNSSLLRDCKQYLGLSQVLLHYPNILPWNCLDYGSQSQAYHCFYWWRWIEAFLGSWGAKIVICHHSTDLCLALRVISYRLLRDSPFGRPFFWKHYPISSSYWASTPGKGIYDSWVFAARPSAWRIESITVVTYLKSSSPQSS